MLGFGLKNPATEVVTDKVAIAGVAAVRSKANSIAARIWVNWGILIVANFKTRPRWAAADETSRRVRPLAGFSKLDVSGRKLLSSS